MPKRKKKTTDGSENSLLRAGVVEPPAAAAFHTRLLAPVLVASFLTQHPANKPGKTTEDDFGSYLPRRRKGVSGS